VTLRADFAMQLLLVAFCYLDTYHGEQLHKLVSIMCCCCR